MRSILKMPSDDMPPNERERALHCDARVWTKPEPCESGTMKKRNHEKAEPRKSKTTKKRNHEKAEPRKSGTTKKGNHAKEEPCKSRRMQKKGDR